MEFLLIFITGILAALLSASVSSKRGMIECVAIVAVIIQGVCVIALGAQTLASGGARYSSYFALDALGALFAGVVALVGCAAAAYSVGYLREEVIRGVIGMHRIRQFYALFHIFLSSMFFAIFTTHPLLMWIAVEATTLSTVFLISFYGKPNTIEAAWKFFIINSVALLLGFLGTLLFIATPSTFGMTWTIPSHSAIDPMLLKVAFVLVIIGYGTKTGFVPMHTWLPDAHSMAPVPISSLLSGALLNVSFFALLRFKLLVDPALGAEFSQSIFLIFGTLSVSVAAFFIVTQHNYKRLLAYSSIEHMGIMALGIGAGGVGVFGALLHMIYHAMTKSLLFLSSGTILLRYGTAKIAGVRGIRAALPWTSLIFFAGVLSITGLPPFGMFVTEFSILSSLVGSHPGIVAIVLCGLTLIFIGFAKHVSDMMMGEPKDDVSPYREGVRAIVPLILLLGVLIVTSVSIPPFLSTLLIKAAGL